MKRSFAFAILGLLAVAMVANATNIQATTVGLWGFNEQAPGTWAVDNGPVIDSADGHNGYIRVGQNGMDSQDPPQPIPITPQYVDPNPACNNPIAALHLNPGYFNEPTDGMGPNYKQDHVVINQDTDDFNLALASGTSYTFEACIKVPTQPYIGEQGHENDLGGTIMCKRSHNEWEHNGGPGWAFRINTTGSAGVAGALALYLEDGGLQFTYPDATGTINVCDNQWHHVAAVLATNADPTLTSVSFYIDNVLDRTVLVNDVVYGKPWINPDIANTYDLWIGDMQGRWNDQFVGDLDGVAFSNAALAPGGGQVGPGYFALNCVPEPSSIVLLVMGALALLAIRRK